MSENHVLIPHRQTEDQAISETGTEGRQVYREETTRAGRVQAGWKTSNQAENNAGTCGTSERRSGSESFKVRGLNAGGEKRGDAGGRPAAVTGADWQMVEARLVRRPGAGEAERSGETPVADRQLGHMLPLPTGQVEKNAK